MSAVGPASIEAAMKVLAPRVRRTPVAQIAGAELEVDATVWFKLEFMQHSGSFKSRGATHFMSTKPVSPDGVVAASGGNHGAAVAWAARQFGHTAHIFVPMVAAPAKVQRLRDYGAAVHQQGEVFADAYRASVAFLRGHDATAIHPYDDPVVMAGAGTCALEFERQAGQLDAVLLACGGGGLSGGAASWFGGRTRTVVCETAGTASYAAAVANGAPVDVEVSGVAADALGATRLGTTPWRALSEAGADSVVVSDEALLRARSYLWERFRLLVEPATAAPVAALLERAWIPEPGARIGIVLCGANTDLA